MRRKRRLGGGIGSAAFDGRKIRSALKWKILATLLGRVAAPVAAARIYEFIRTGSSRNLREWIHRVRHPSHVYVYLYRMAKEGLVTLDRLGEALEATLTEQGRTELERYSTHWQERGVDSPEGLAAGPRPRVPAGRPAATASRPAAPPEEAAGRAPCAGSAGGRPAGDGPAALAVECRRRMRQRRAGGRREGFGGSTGFVSYDLPMRLHNKRRRLLAVLKAGGYASVHASMYAGPGQTLGAVIQTLEATGLTPHVRWGSLRLMHR